MSQFEEQVKESLSALMDDESSDLEARRILKELEIGDANQASMLRNKWRRYHIASAAIKGSSISNFDYSESIAEAISSEKPLKISLMPKMVNSAGRFAIAASVAVISILGVQGLNQDSRMDGEAAKFAQIDESAVNNFTGPMNQIPFSVRVPQEGSLSTVSAESGKQKQYSDQQTQAYILYILSKHSAESSDLSNHGILPYSRIEERQRISEGEQ